MILFWNWTPDGEDGGDLKQRNLHTNHCLVFGPNRLSGCAIVGLRLRAKLRKESCPILFGQTASAHNTAASCEIVVSMPCKSHTHSHKHIHARAGKCVLQGRARVAELYIGPAFVRACVVIRPAPDRTTHIGILQINLNLTLLGWLWVWNFVLCTSDYVCSIKLSQLTKPLYPCWCERIPRFCQQTCQSEYNVVFAFSFETRWIQFVRCAKSC